MDRNRIHQYIVTNGLVETVLVVRCRTMDESYKTVQKMLSDRGHYGWRASLVADTPIEQYMQSLGLDYKPITFVIQEDETKPKVDSLEAMAEMLRDNGYVVYKNKKRLWKPRKK